MRNREGRTASLETPGSRPATRKESALRQPAPEPWLPPGLPEHWTLAGRGPTRGACQLRRSARQWTSTASSVSALEGTVLRVPCLPTEPQVAQEQPQPPAYPTRSTGT